MYHTCSHPEQSTVAADAPGEMTDTYVCEVAPVCLVSEILESLVSSATNLRNVYIKCVDTEWSKLLAKRIDAPRDGVNRFARGGDK